MKLYIPKEEDYFKSYSKELEQYIEKLEHENERIYTKLDNNDKEIERQKEVINGMIENEEKYNLEIIRLKSIIKEVREYIENNKIYTNEKQEAYTLKNTWYGLELLGILDKGE